MPPSRRMPNASQASTVFVDREEPKRTFEKAALSIPGQGCSLLTWYGVGGQGKTALARELFRISSAEVEPSYAHLRRAMLDLHGRPKTDPDRLLVWIRNAFARSGVAFPAFDLAFAVMWEKTRGEDPLPNFERPWLHRTGDALAETIPDTVAITREFLEETAQTIPGLGFLVKRGTQWAFDKGKRAWLERTRHQLKELYRNGQLIEPYEMSVLMPWMLAQDINRHLSDNPDDRFVLFIDEYESVMDGAGTGARWRENPFDEHMRSFIAETDGLLAIFFSREKLPWEFDLDWAGSLKGNQHLLGGLSGPDADQWLRKVPISDEAIRLVIIEGARETSEEGAPVYPLMLDLQVEHWRNLGEAARPQDFRVRETSFFARRQRLIERLLRDYDEPFQAVLRRLALPLRFDRRAFEHVVKTFNIPLAFEAFDRLRALSIMTEDEEGWLSMHRAVADAIIQALTDGTLDQTRDRLIEHFSNRAMPETAAMVSDETLACFSEASRLRAQQDAEGYIDWLDKLDDKIFEAFRSIFLENVWRSALDFALCEQGDHHHQTAMSYNNLASNLDAQGRASDAEPMYRKSLEIYERLLGLEHSNTATCYNNLASNLDAQGRASDAEPMYRKSLEIYERLLGAEHLQTATACSNLATNLQAQGRASEAESLHRRSLDIRERVLGPEHPHTAMSYNNLASNLDAQGRASDAEPMYRKAIDIRERVLGPEHPLTATACNNLATNLQAQGRASEAESLHRRSLDIRERVLGLEHPQTATSYNNLASNLDAQGRASDAEPMYRKSFDINERVLGLEHPQTAMSCSNLALNLDAQGRTTEAESLHRRALDIRERVLGPEHPHTATSYNNLALNLDAQGRASDAEPMYRKSLDTNERVLGREHPHTAISYNNLASNLDAQGRVSEAEPLHHKSLDICERVLGPEHPHTTMSYSNLALNLDAQGRLSEAERLHRRSLDIRERVLGLEHPQTAMSYANLALNLDAQGRASDAEPMYRKALDIRERVLGPEHPHTATSYNNLASNLDAQGRASEAEPIYRKSLDIRERVLGQEHPFTVFTKVGYWACRLQFGDVEEARKVYLKVLDSTTRHTPRTEYWMGRIKLKWAVGLQKAGFVEEARDAAEEVISLLKSELVEEHHLIRQARSIIGGTDGQ